MPVLKHVPVPGAFLLTLFKALKCRDIEPLEPYFSRTIRMEFELVQDSLTPADLVCVLSASCSRESSCTLAGKGSNIKIHAATSAQVAAASRWATSAHGVLT